MPQPPLLALIDGHALAFRAFHALRAAGLRASTGEPTYAVFGFAQILLTMIQEQHPTYVAVAFDIGRTFRDELYAEYKAGRAETPEEFHPQLARIKQLVTALAIPIYTAQGFEADDVIGTLAQQATAQGIDTLILTGDTDTLQLVDNHVRVLLANPYGQQATTTIYDTEKVRERYKGLHPHQLADLRGLKGDTSDNIPGVRGIGETGAITLLKQFGSIDGIYAAFDEVPTRYRKRLEGQQEAAHFSRHLAVIVRDVPVHLDRAAATLVNYDRSTVITLFQELEIGASSGLLKKLPPSSATPAGETTPTTPPTSDTTPITLPLFATADVPHQAMGDDPAQLSLFDMAPLAAPASSASVVAALGDYRAITDEAGLNELLTVLANAPGFAFDTELSGLSPLRDDLVGISLAVRPGAAWYIPIGHRSGSQLPRQQVLDALAPFFADPQRPKYAHNAKFDIEVLGAAGLTVEGLAFDTMLAAGLLNKRMALKEVAFFELKLPHQMTEFTEVVGKGAKQVTFDQVPIAQATPYAAADADMTLRLMLALAPQLDAQAHVRQIFQRIELPLVSVLVAMEQAGIRLDVDYIRDHGIHLGAQIAEHEAKIYDYVGDRFNINSSDQLGEMLFERLGLPTEGIERTAKTKKYSLTADMLEKLRHLHPIIEEILHYRQLGKLKSTYVDALLTLVNPRTKRVHTSYNQLGAATGRLSSVDPNLQNIPIRTEEGRAIRRAFVAEPGHQLIAADYSQIELRVLAHVCRDPALVSAFAEGQDIHAATAAQLFGVAPDAVDKQQRRVAKTVVFGVIYGISAFGLAQRLDIDRSYAQALIDQLFARFPGIRTYIENTLAMGREQGYVKTLFGRQRTIPDLQTRGPRRQAAEREAINAPIQGTAADIMKLAMMAVANSLKAHHLRTRVLLQVHDELVLEAPDDEVATVCQLVREAMEQVFALCVPLKVAVEVGVNWEEMIAL